MKTRPDGTKKTTYGAGPKGPTTTPRGPGKGGMRKAGMPSKRMVEDKYCK